MPRTVPSVSPYLLRPLRSLDEVLAERGRPDAQRRRPVPEKATAPEDRQDGRAAALVIMA